MSVLDSLTISQANRRTDKPNPTILRRQRMLASLSEQLAAAKAELAGDHYSRSVIKTVKNAAGESERKAVTKRFRPMWWKSGDSVMLSLTYALRPVKIGSGNSIVVGEIGNLVPTLETVKRAVEAGELDEAMKEIADGRKRGGQAKKDGKPVGNGSGAVMLAAATTKKAAK